MQKAQLAGGQIVAAVLAGFLANLLFSAGWTLVGVSVFGGIIVSLVGVSLPRLVGSFADAEQLEQVVSRAGAALGVIAIVIVVIGVLLMALGVVASGLILRAGKARRPWAVTWSAIGISALLGLPCCFCSPRSPVVATTRASCSCRSSARRSSASFSGCG